MDFQERIKRCVPAQGVAEILQCIGAPSNKRDTPVAGDLEGPFDFWFDGGAATIMTGTMEYSFASGARATLFAPSVTLRVGITFPNGTYVSVVQPDETA
jgi:hypothetical protein